jgi:hydroxypyruvate isomerase
LYTVSPLRFDVNLSILFTELPLLRRPAAAWTAGFGAVEFWWPFDVAVPGDRDVDAFVRAVGDTGTDLVSLNFFAGDMAAGERGLLSRPGREAELADSVDVALGIGDRLGCRTFNALYGNRVAGLDPAAQDELAIATLDAVAARAARAGAGLVLEPLSGIPGYPLRTAADVVTVLDTLGRDNVTMLADLYHLAVNGDDLDAVLAAHAPRIGHVQIADAPGRGAPGTGSLDLPRYLERLAKAGYRGSVGLEYRPAGASADAFGWLPRERRG